MNNMASKIDRRIVPRLLILSKLLFSMLVMSYYAEALPPITKNARMKKWNNLNNNNNNNRRRKLQLETTDNSADDKSYQLLQKKFHNVTDAAAAAASATAAATKQASNKDNELCTPIEECELCPHKWKQFLEKDDEKIEGEYESCTKYGRRQQFECTVLFQENETSEKVARGRTEYKPCRYTESDEASRMLQMQLVCLILGIWAVRNVRRFKVTSASLFDQRRMMRGNNNIINQGSGGGVGGANNNDGSPSKSSYKAYSKKDTLDTIELGPLIPAVSGAGKVPKSPAPINI